MPLSLNSLVLKEALTLTLSMVLFKTSPVVPTNVTWLAMLLLIGILGLASQVRSSLPPSLVADPA
jgi:hypothetical protein